MQANYQDSLYFENKWLSSESVTSDYVDHSNHFEKGNFMELRSYNHNGEPHIFQAKKYLDNFLLENKRRGIENQKSTQDLLNISYDLLKKNNLINSKIHLIAYLKSGKSYVSVSASGTYPIGIRENMKLTEDEYSLADKGDEEIKHVDSRSIFFSKDDVLYTPRVEGGQETSFLRDAIIESAIRLGYPVIEKSISITELRESDVVFYSDNSNEITLVGQLGDHHFTSNWRESGVMDILMHFRHQASHDEGVDAII